MSDFLTVVLFQYRLLHYRVALFERMRALCHARGINLQIVYGQPSDAEKPKNDTGTLAWGRFVRNWFLRVGGRDLVWQPFPRDLRKADLVVVMQENRILSNYPLLLKRLLGHTGVAYWGHGKNFQSNAPNGIREQWKMWLLNKVDWWFAYTGLTKAILVENGFPESRITCLNNAIDNEGFEIDLGNVGEEALSSLRVELGLMDSAPLGLFCGSLYPDKRLEFMFEAAKKIHEEIPLFRFVVIGDGPSAPQLRSLTDKYPWMHCVGVKKGLAKAEYFKLASVILNPGAVGLHVLDAFCAGLPMFTTENARHGPEVEYLQHGINGYILQDDPVEYAKSVISLLSDPVRYEKVSLAAFESGKVYTLQNMAENFVDGIEKCLRKS